MSGSNDNDGDDTEVKEHPSVTDSLSSPLLNNNNLFGENNKKDDGSGKEDSSSESSEKQSEDGDSQLGILNDRYGLSDSNKLFGERNYQLSSHRRKPEPLNLDDTHTVNRDFEILETPNSADFLEKAYGGQNLVEQGGVTESDVEARLDEFEENISSKIKNQVDAQADRIRDEFERSKEQMENMLHRLEEREDDLSSALDDIQNQREKISQLTERAEGLEQEYSNLVQGESAETIGKHFEERKNKIRKSLRGWLFASAVSIAILLGSSFWIYTDISNTGATTFTIVSKIALIVPVSVAVWFSVSNYSRQKKLMREYEFKEGMARSLIGFIEILREDMPEEERPDVGQFAAETMNKIYSNPQENIAPWEDNEDGSSPGPSGGAPNPIKSLFR